MAEMLSTLIQHDVPVATKRPTHKAQRMHQHNMHASWARFFGCTTNSCVGKGLQRWAEVGAIPTKLRGRL